MAMPAMMRSDRKIRAAEFEADVMEWSEDYLRTWLGVNGVPSGHQGYWLTDVVLRELLRRRTERKTNV